MDSRHHHEIEDLQVQVETLKGENETLLEALKGCTDELDKHDGNPHCGLSGITDIPSVLERCRAAIAKAEGRES